MSIKRKTVFISYSWDSADHQEWVLRLAKDLMEKFGVNVILDQFELSAGRDLTHFMETSIERADKVLIILTPNYKLKAENRERGVGYETSMISQEMFESPISMVKFIPILRSGTQNDSSPKFLKSKVYHPMDNDDEYLKRVFELSKTIYDKPLIQKPELGDIPDLDKEDFDPVIDMANNLAQQLDINNRLNSILDSSRGVEMFETEIQKLNNALQEKTQHYNSSTSLLFNYETNSHDGTIISALGYSVSFYWAKQYSNTTKGSLLTVKYWNGVMRIETGHYFPGREPRIIKDVNYHFDLDLNKSVSWRSHESRKVESLRKSTSDLIKNAFIFILESIKKEKGKQFRR